MEKSTNMVDWCSLIDACDCVSYGKLEAGIWKFIYTADLNDKSQDESMVLGYVRPNVVKSLKECNIEGFVFHKDTIELDKSLDFEGKNKLFAKIGAQWRDEDRFGVLRGWRNELYPIYGYNGNVIFLVERAVTPLFGFITYGVHLTAFVPASDQSPMKIWVPQRSKTKQTFPLMLDNTVAGGIAYPCTKWETIIKECEEEAGWSKDFVETRAKSVSVVSYFYLSHDGWFQPEVIILFYSKNRN